VYWAAVWAAAGIAASIALAGADSAAAQARLDARYTATLAGIPIGKGASVIDLAETQFTAAASGSTAGLLRLFASGNGTAASRGAMVAGKPVPASFATTITSDTKTEEIRMTLGAGDVKEYVITPPLPPPEPERVAVTEAHRRGVVDPMTATLVRVPGNGDPVSPKACERIAPIFDGRMRYNVHFAYKRMEQVKADKGYQGPAVACAMYFTPIAGHIPSRAVIKYLTTQREMEIWLAPIGNTRMLVPFRMSIPTPVGLGVLYATQFVAVPQPRAAAAVPKLH
jgi:hypothetical protein